MYDRASGRDAWARRDARRPALRARCVAAAYARPSYARETRTREVEYRRDLHPDAIGHFAIVIGDVPLVPEGRPLVDLGDEPIRVHLHLVPHAVALAEPWAEPSCSARTTTTGDDG